MQRDLLAELHGLSTSVLLAALLILSSFLTSCSDLAAAPEAGPLPGEFSPDGGSEYGVEGGATDHQIEMIASLAWPQSRADMVGTLGLPLHFTQFADYYQASGNRWLIIYYSGPNATGYSLEAQ